MYKFTINDIVNSFCSDFKDLVAKFLFKMPV